MSDSSSDADSFGSSLGLNSDTDMTDMAAEVVAAEGNAGNAGMLPDGRTTAFEPTHAKTTEPTPAYKPTPAFVPTPVDHEILGKVNSHGRDATDPRVLKFLEEMAKKENIGIFVAKKFLSLFKRDIPQTLKGHSSVFEIHQENEWVVHVLVLLPLKLKEGTKIIDHAHFARRSKIITKCMAGLLAEGTFQIIERPSTAKVLTLENGGTSSRKRTCPASQAFLNAVKAAAANEADNDAYVKRGQLQAIAARTPEWRARNKVQDCQTTDEALKRAADYILKKGYVNFTSSKQLSSLFTQKGRKLLRDCSRKYEEAMEEQLSNPPPPKKRFKNNTSPSSIAKVAAM